MPRNLSGRDLVAIPVPNLGPDQDVARFDESIEMLRRSRLDLVSLCGRGQFVAGPALLDVDEPIPKAGREPPLNLAHGPHDLGGSVEVASLGHPAAHAG